MKWEVLSSEYLSHHQYFTARKDRCQKPDGKIVPEYFVVELPTSATAFALTEDEQVVMVQQYRHPIETVIYETPGGFIDPGEDALAGMQRELLEETGYAFPSIAYLGKVAANPGVLNNYTELYLATGGKKVAQQQLDHNEDIIIALLPLQEVIDQLLNNQIHQSLHANCIMYALLKMGKLRLQ